MADNWNNCRNILCIRLDNLGDLLMSSPAIRALKETLRCRITVLTSSMAAGIVPLLPDVDDCLIFDVPWVKLNNADLSGSIPGLVDTLREKRFDAAIIFTVFSQNPLPAALITYLAGIPLRLAYCRENPYQLLTTWVPDQEPYTLIRHQVQRDLDLVQHIGARTTNQSITIKIPQCTPGAIDTLLQNNGVNTTKPWIILHPGVSEEKRKYGIAGWITIARRLGELGYQTVLTGTQPEAGQARAIASEAGNDTFVLAGKLSLAEFVLLIHHAPLVVSVNTGTIHIAAATGTPVVVLYAMTNPQHTPWRAAGKVLPFAVTPASLSRNEVIRHWTRSLPDIPQTVEPEQVLEAITGILEHRRQGTLLPRIRDNELNG
jgi:lipopolysaccharide heptosyltransferase II